jgi:type IV pilus assembly protein PilE
MRRHGRGFTLIELLIGMVVVAILAAVAVPGYNNQMRKARRAEAREALMQLQAAQERWRTNNVSYATSVTELGQSATTGQGNYALAISGATGAAYTATATAQAKQASDSECAAMTVTVAGGTTTYGPTNACWGR